MGRCYWVDYLDLYRFFVWVVRFYICFFNFFYTDKRIINLFLAQVIRLCFSFFLFRVEYISTCFVIYNLSIKYTN